MKGKKSIHEVLNNVLTMELTAINQYFLHARMLQDWGFSKIGQLEYQASIDEMKHADQLIQRILFLEGIPNVQRVGKIHIGENVEDIIKNDLALEYHAVKKLQEYIALTEQESDFVSRDLLSDILTSEEDHIDWLETQQNLIDKTGVANYIQSQIEMK